MRKLQTAEARAISQSVLSISNSGPLRSWWNRLSHTFFLSNLHKRYRKISCVACVCHYSTVNESNQKVETDPLRSNFLFFFLLSSCSLKSFDDLFQSRAIYFFFFLKREHRSRYIVNKKTGKEIIYLHPKTLQSSDKVRDYVQVVIPFESKWRAGNGYWSGLGLHC